MVMREDSDDNVQKTALSASALPHPPTISPPHFSTSFSPSQPTSSPISQLPTLPIANFSPVDRHHHCHLSFYPIYKISHTITPYDFGLVDFSSAAVELHLLNQGFYVVGRRSGCGVRINGQSLFSRSFLRRPVCLRDGDVLSFACARSGSSSSTWFDVKVTFDSIELDRRESVVLTRCLPSRIQSAPFHTRSSRSSEGVASSTGSCTSGLRRNINTVDSIVSPSRDDASGAECSSPFRSNTTSATSYRQCDNSATSSRVMPTSAAAHDPSSLIPVARVVPNKLPSESLYPRTDVPATSVLTSGLGSNSAPSGLHHAAVAGTYASFPLDTNTDIDCVGSEAALSPAYTTECWRSDSTSVPGSSDGDHGGETSDAAAMCEASRAYNTNTASSSHKAR